MKRINSNFIPHFIIAGVLLAISGIALSKNFHVLKHNSDKHYDLLAINDSDELVVQIGGGDGAFSIPSVISLDFTPAMISLGDIDGDGLKDLLALDTSGDLSLSLNDGIGGFADEVVLNVGLALLEDVTDITTGDVNGDGLLDVVVSVNGLLNARVVVLENDGSGGFLSLASIELGLLGSIVSVDVLDINGDGADDIVGRGLLGAVYSILSDGLGGHNAPSLSLSGLPTGRIFFNDYNNDGIPDLIVLDEVLGLLTVRLGVGDGTYGSGTSVSVGLLPSDLVTVDINNDSFKDVVVINVLDGTANVLLGDGLGGLVNAVGVLLSDLLGTIGGLGLDLPMAVVSADFNGDCRADLAVWSDLLNSYVITMNQTGPDPADLIFCAVFDDMSAN